MLNLFLYEEKHDAFTSYDRVSILSDALLLQAGIPCKLSPEAWIKDLAGTKPLSVLAKKVCIKISLKVNSCLSKPVGCC